MFYFLIFFWLFRQTKAILFWLYLWQLKEYHIGRFIDHFRTEKGKQLLFNKLLILKIILILFFLFFASFAVIQSSPFYREWILFLIVLYFLEVAKGFSDFFRKKLLIPVLTKKILFLLFANFILTIFYFFSFPFDKNLLPLSLLVFDILTPAVVSGMVLVVQPLAALGRNQIIKRAKKKRAQFKNLLVIGITGSYGKTSTKEFLATFLSQKYKVLKTAEHQNSEVGISQCILNDLKEEHEIFVVEMGAYNEGGIKLLCDIVKPKIGILTGINEQHMATFGSLENIIKTKYELIESLPRSEPKVLLRGLPIESAAFFNAKNKYCLGLYQKTKIKKTLYGKDVKLAGLENIEGAKAVARELDMSEEEISRGCESIENKFAGTQLKKGINGLNVIDATYSANPDGVIAHLEYLTLRYPQGKKIIVMTCLIELGPASKEVHKRIGQKIGEVCNLAIITTKERFKEIKEGASERGMEEENILFIEKPKEIFEKIKSFCQPGDIVLLESRVPREVIDLLNA